MSGLVTIASFSDLASAYIARSKLESAEIPCFLSDEYTVGVNCFYSGFVQGIDLRVNAADVAFARELLTEDVSSDNLEGLAPEDKELVPDLEAALLEPGPVCPRCGSTDVVRRSWGRSLLALCYLLVFPLPLQRDSRRCRACGAKWRDGAEG